MIQAQGQFYQIAKPSIIYTVISIYPHPLYDGGVMWYSSSEDPTQDFMSMKDFKQKVDQGIFKVI